MKRFFFWGDAFNALLLIVILLPLSMANNVLAAADPAASPDTAALMAFMEKRFKEMEAKLQASEARLKAAEQKLSQQSVQPSTVHRPIDTAKLDNAPSVSNQEVIKEVAELKTRLIASEKNAAEVEKTSAKIYAGEEGFKLTSASGDHQLRANALIQFDVDDFFAYEGLNLNNGTSSPNVIGESTIDRMWLRRVRPIISGTLFKYADFKIQSDFGQSQVRLFDAYGDLHYLNYLAVMGGKTVNPVAGIEQIKNAGALNVMEMGYPAMMAPNRSYGLILHGDFSGTEHDTKYNGIYNFDEVVNYQLGVVNGDADNSSPGLNPTSPNNLTAESTTTTPDAYVARLFTNPFKFSDVDALKGLGIGIAGSYDKPIGQSYLPSMASIGQNAIFSYSQLASANGTRLRAHPQMYWYYGPFGLLADYAVTSQRLCDLSSNSPTNTSCNDTESITQTNQAGQAQVTYMLTGEKNGYGVLKPNKNFNPFDEQGGWGAWQLALRWSGLAMDKEAFSKNAKGAYAFANPYNSVQSANTLTIGMNWFLNRNIKVTSEYDYTNFVGGCSSARGEHACISGPPAVIPASSAIIDRPSENIWMNRLQVLF